MDGTTTLTTFLRRSGEILTRAEVADVLLRRRDGEDIVLTIRSRSDGRAAALSLLGETVLEALRADSTLEDALAASQPWTAALTGSERNRLLADVAAAGAAAAELGTAEILGQTMSAWRDTARLRVASAPTSSANRHPVIPDDVDGPAPKAHGVVELPLRVRWSGGQKRYDLDDPRQLRRVYEQVLREGNEDDIRAYIDIEHLIEHWDHLVLPGPVRRAWARWIKQHRGLELPC